MRSLPYENVVSSYNINLTLFYNISVLLSNYFEFSTSALQPFNILKTLKKRFAMIGRYMGIEGSSVVLKV